MNEKVAHSAALRSVEVDGFSPRRAMPVGKKLWRVGVEVISLRTEVIVNNIQQHHHPVVVRSLDQSLQVFRAAVGTVGCKRKNPIIAPVGPPPKISDGHKFDGGAPKTPKKTEPHPDRRKSSRRRKSSD